MLILDNFSRQMFEACPQKYYWRMREHLVLKEPKNMALYLGIAIHKGLEEYYRSGDKVEAIKTYGLEYAKYYDGKDLDRTLENGLIVMEQYFKQYEEDYLETFSLAGEPLVEVGGAMIIGDVIYNMRMDWIAKNKVEGSLTVVDHKTSKYPGSSFNTIKPNNALTGYILGAREITGMDIDTAMLNIIGTNVRKRLKDGQEPVDCVRDFTKRDKEDFDRFKKEIVKVSQRIKECDSTGLWERQTGACPSFNGCEYRDLCNASEEALPHLVKTLYKEEPWVAFNEGH